LRLWREVNRNDDAHRTGDPVWCGVVGVDPVMVATVPA
jgi:hypothetical protein